MTRRPVVVHQWNDEIWHIPTAAAAVAPVRVDNPNATAVALFNGGFRQIQAVQQRWFYFYSLDYYGNTSRRNLLRWYYLVHNSNSSGVLNLSTFGGRAPFR
jgi:hypothetical protein